MKYIKLLIVVSKFLYINGHNLGLFYISVVLIVVSQATSRPTGAFTQYGGNFMYITQSSHV